MNLMLVVNSFESGAGLLKIDLLSLDSICERFESILDSLLGENSLKLAYSVFLPK